MSWTYLPLAVDKPPALPSTWLVWGERLRLHLNAHFERLIPIYKSISMYINVCIYVCSINQQWVQQAVAAAVAAVGAAFCICIESHYKCETLQRLDNWIQFHSTQLSGDYLHLGYLVACPIGYLWQQLIRQIDCHSIWLICAATAPIASGLKLP